MNVTLLTKTPGKRLQFAASVFFRCDVQCIDPDAFDSNGIQSDVLVVAHGIAHPTAHLTVPASGWLEDGVIRVPEIQTGTWLDIPTLFHQHGEEIPFDLFAAVFFLASRFEEYLRFEADQMGRFFESSSWCGQHGLTQRPLIDEWRVALFQFLEPSFNGLTRQLPRWSMLMTVDVDSAFAYRHKGAFRTLGGMAKDVSGFRFANFIKRCSALIRLSRDPHDTYQTIIEACQQNQVPLHWFFLLADFGEFDKNVSHRSEALRQLVRRLDLTAKVGIHPGIGSHTSETVLKKECERLASILGHEVVSSRQHYLKLTFPETYRRLISAGIREDYTMGYAGRTGFRLGTSLSIPWYDVERDELTPLQLFPFCAMDATLRKYMRLTPSEACDELSKLADVTRKTGGQFVLLWHNESISNMNEWAGWERVFDHALSLSRQ